MKELSAQKPAVPPGYKMTEVGVIPTDWDTIDLFEFCTLQRGFDITESSKSSGNIPVYTSSGLSYYHNKAMVMPPGVVTGRKGILGKVFLINEPFWPHDTTLWVKNFNGNIPAYVALVLQNFHLERLDAATSVPTLNRNNLKGYKIAVTSNSHEQKAIAEALSDADGLIESLEQLIAKKRLIKQGTMQELLTGKKRLPGFEIKKGYKKTELGMIPEEWIVDQLGNLLKSSPSYGLNAPAIPYDSRFPTYLRITDITDDGNFLDEFKVSVNHSLSEKYKLNDGDIVFARTGATVGKSYYYDNKVGELVYAGFLICISPDPNKLISKYLSYVLQTKFYWDWVKSNSMRSGQPGINGQEFSSFLFSFPVNTEEQTAIATILSDMDDEIAALESKLTKTRQIKQGMMHNLLTGKKRLVESGKLRVDSGGISEGVEI